MCWEPAAEHLRSDGQQVGDEVVWVEEGADEREGETEGDRTLDHPPLLKLQASGLYFNHSFQSLENANLTKGWFLAFSRQ